MAFPYSDLDVIVSVYLGADPTADPGDWPAATDFTARLVDEPIHISRGRPPGQKTLGSGSCSFTLHDDDGYLTPDNPHSPYYGDWDLGVPVQLQVDNVGASPPYSLFCGYVASIDSTFIPGTGGKMLRVVRVTLGGVLRRMTQGSVPRSALRRTITGANATSPVGYWPLESEGTDATILSSAVAGGLDASVPTGLTPGGAVGPAGSAGAAAIEILSANTYDNIGPLVLPVGSYTDTGTVLVTAHVRQDPPDGATWFTSIQTMLNGTIGRLAVAWTHAGFLVTPTDADGFSTGPDVITYLTPGLIEDGAWHELQLLAAQDGADVDVSLYLDGSLLDSGTLASQTLGAVTSIGRFAADIDGTPSAVVDLCHVAVHTSNVGDFTDAMNAYAGEEAHVRFLRICAEEGIPNSCAAADSRQVGPQPVADTMAILRDGELVDHGVLSELATTWGLEYLAASQRYNLSPAMTVDLSTYRRSDDDSAGDVLTPVRNDQRIRNEWTISRPDGASATVVDAAHQKKKGRYNDSATVNVANDPATLDEAGWRVHEGTYDGRRYQGFPVNLGANNGGADGSDDLLGDWLASVDLGSRIDRTNAPIGLADEAMTLEGYAATIRRRAWQVQCVIEPYAPWQVAEYSSSSAVPADDPDRYDTAGCDTAAGLWLPGADRAATPDNASIDITGDIDVRACVVLNNWLSSSDQTLVAKWDADTGSQRSWRLTMISGNVQFAWSTNGSSTSGTANSTVKVEPPRDGRLSIRATMDVNNGAAGNTVTFYTSTDTDLSSASWTQLGSPVVNSGTPSLFNSTAEMSVGADGVAGDRLMDGIVLAAQVRNGIGGTIVANPDFAAQAAGTTSFADSAGRTWTMHDDAEIFHDFVSGTDTDLLVWSTFPPGWTDAPGDLPMQLRCAGAILSITAATTPAQVQVLTVSTTVVNGVEKTITPGESIALARPPIYAQ